MAVVSIHLCGGDQGIGDMQPREPYRLPPELVRWGWSFVYVKRAPKKHPGQWVEFLFKRFPGKALGDDALASEDASLRIKVRRSTEATAWRAGVREMYQRSAKLTARTDTDVE